MWKQSFLEYHFDDNFNYLHYGDYIVTHVGLFARKLRKKKFSTDLPGSWRWDGAMGHGGEC